MVKSRFMAVGLLVTLCGGWMSYSIVSYFTHTTPPHVELIGLKQDGKYRGVVACSLKGNSSYKVSHINVYVDEQPLPLASVRGIKAKEFERPFELDTIGLAQGMHSIKIEAIDTSYKANMSSRQWNFSVDNTPIQAAFLQSDYSLEQGRTLHVQFQANKKLNSAFVTFRGKQYRCTPESDFSSVYECFIPTECDDQPNEHLLTARLEDEVANVFELQTKMVIKQSEFKKARGFSVAARKLEQEREESRSNKQLDQALEELLKDSSDTKLWSGAFIAPMEIDRITTPFGEVRTTAEKGRYHHAAIDIVNTPKSVVWATERGKVIIKDRFLHSGNTVVIDHGLGVMSLYFHLEDFADIQVGELLKKGAPVGRMGKTGYASGYHLHWEVRVNNTPVDPLQWTLKTF